MMAGPNEDIEAVVDTINTALQTLETPAETAAYASLIMLLGHVEALAKHGQRRAAVHISKEGRRLLAEFLFDADNAGTTKH
jgi:hypothetical protein